MESVERSTVITWRSSHLWTNGGTRGGSLISNFRPEERSSLLYGGRLMLASEIRNCQTGVQFWQQIHVLSPTLVALWGSWDQVEHGEDTTSHRASEGGPSRPLPLMNKAPPPSPHLPWQTTISYTVFVPFKFPGPFSCKWENLLSQTVQRWQ